MKKYLLSLLFITFSFVGVFAQETPGEGGRLQAYKMAFLTKKLNLTPEEAQRFWPVFNKYEQEIRSVRIANKDKNGDVIETEEKILNIRKKYTADFGKALSPERVNDVYRAEKEFGTIVQKELLERRQNPNNKRRN